MTEPSESTVHSLDSQDKPEVGLPEAQHDEAPKLRQSSRIRSLTEKGKEMQEEKCKGLQQKFNYTYDKWKTQAKLAKKSLSQLKDRLSEELLKDIIGDIEGFSADVQLIYDELRNVSTLDQDTRRKVDLCVEISNFIVSKASSRLDGEAKEAEEVKWPEAGSLFGTSSSKSGSFTTELKVPSINSSRSSIKRQEAAAEAAASEAVLKVLEQQEKEQQEIQRLEAEVKRKISDEQAAIVKRSLEREAEEVKIKAQLEEEHGALLRALEEKRRKVQKLEAVKNLNAARARMQVYDQPRAAEEEQMDTLGQQLVADNPVIPPSNRLSMQKSPIQSTSTGSNESTAELVKVLADALSANRVPIPEPSIFSGDPLKYNDWKLSFQTLIGHKNIEDKEKIYYLRQYVSGLAKKAIDGFFLLGTESAYASAWKILKERYGNPFTVAMAYRDKLQAWPKIGSKDNFELREFVDFLCSCEAAMVHIKALEILNDCNENRRILSKLPDWLIAGWNRKVVDEEEDRNQFPSFSQFVKFLTREVKIACNPVTSLQSLKQAEPEKSQRQHSVGAKTLTTSSNEGFVIMMCLFCKKNGHTLHKCRNFRDNPISDRITFIQAEKLCFGCLKLGHHSKSCYSRSVCDVCSNRHPTCLHEERSKEQQTQPRTERNTSKEKPRPSQERNNEFTQSTQHQGVFTAATANRVLFHEPNMQTASIIPVWLSATTQPAREILVYALLDSQSDTTFALSEVVEALEVTKEQVNLKLSTLSSKTTVVSSQKVNNLQVRGFFSGKKIALPPIYTREFIPANRTHIPTDETAKSWSHLEPLQGEIAPLQDFEVGLLIGYKPYFQGKLFLARITILTHSVQTLDGALLATGISMWTTVTTLE